ncbi:MAG: YcfL family protein [Rhizobacter sp.]
MNSAKTLVAIVLAATCQWASAQSAPVAAPEAGSAASKLMLRGDAYGVNIIDMRAQKRSDILVVQTELLNTAKADRQVFWRYRWLDASGMQVGDGEVWKPLLIYGEQSQYLRGTAPGMNVVDFRLEMNVEKR